jgi:hypothetical protein
MSAFDREVNRGNDTETVGDNDDYGHEGDKERDYGDRPQRGSKPRTINLKDLAKTDRNNNLPPALRKQGAKNLTNRVPGIAELLEADSEVVRNLGRKTVTTFNPQFLEQQRNAKDQRDSRLDEKQDYLYDRAERERRHEERERLREERHRREMQQRSKFHKEAAKTGEVISTTLEDLNEAMVARTNQLGTLIEVLRADLLEAQVEQQSLQKKLSKQLATQDTHVKSQLSWILVAALVVLALVSLTVAAQIVWPYVKRRWFNATPPVPPASSTSSPSSAALAPASTMEKPSTSSSAGATAAGEAAKEKTALESSDDLSI